MQFQASFKEAVTPFTYGVELADDCSKLFITDESYYTDPSPESGHDLPDFSVFRKIIVEDPNGNPFVYISLISSVTSLPIGDVLITPPVSNPAIQVTYDILEGDGVYTIKLIVVPTWSDIATYQPNDDFVVVGNVAAGELLKFYKALTVSTNSDPTANPVDWQEVTEADLSAKYSTYTKVVVICDLCCCKDKAVHKAFCMMKEQNCNNDVLCKNSVFLNAMKLTILLEAIEDANALRQYDEIQEMINLGNTICECCC